MSFNVCVIGTGYVGLVTGTCLAEVGHNVICVDIDQNKIEKLKLGIIPIYEPGLNALVKSNSKSGRLSFTTDLASAVNKSFFVFIAVGTPPGEDGSADLSHVLKVAEQIGKSMAGSAVVINKSTVPVGTGDKVKAAIQKELDLRGSGITFDIVSNPEFLKEGEAIKDFMEPDRIVIGCDRLTGRFLTARLYKPFEDKGYPIVAMDLKSSELTKYAANSMLATRISFMNELSVLCEKVGADIEQVRKGIGADKRIGPQFLKAGVGYGGSCFPKDVKALVSTMKQEDVPSLLLTAVEEVNDRQRLYFLDKIFNKYQHNISGLKFAIWGLSFKPDTDDVREAPAMDIIEALTQLGAQVKVYDPVATAQLPSGAVQVPDMYNALHQADALIIMTEWKQFKSADLKEVKLALKQPVIFDGRNMFEPEQMKRDEWDYICIGR